MTRCFKRGKRATVNWFFISLSVSLLTACGGGGSGSSSGNAVLGEILDGFGSIGGNGYYLTDTVLTDSNPSSFRAEIDFGSDPYDASDFSLLSSGSQKILTDSGTPTSSSVIADSFAFDYLFRANAATLLKSEMEITYTNPGGTKTDFLTEIESLKIGVSVTRAYLGALAPPYTVTDAQTLLNAQLDDVNQSSSNVDPADSWSKQILIVFAYSPLHGDQLETAWDTLISAPTKADTVLIVLVTNGDDDFMY